MSTEEKIQELDFLKGENRTLKVENKKLVGILENVLNNITDIDVYLELLREIQTYCLLIISVRDTPGKYLSTDIIQKLHSLGFTKFSNDLWRMYIGVNNNGKNICNLVGEKSEVPINYEGDNTLPEIELLVSSMAWRQGDKSTIKINGVDYSANSRGINIVVYDIANKRLIDSVGFDYHEQQHRVFRKKQEDYLKNVDFSRNSKLIVKEKLLTKPIVLWGSEEVTTDFCEKYQHMLNIQKIVTRIDSERGTHIFDYKVENYSKKLLPQDAYIIICRENKNYYDGTKKVLNNDGFSLLNDYIRYDIADAILSGKEIVVFLGYCQLLGIKQVLDHCPSFTKSYFTKHFQIGWHTKKGDYRYDEFQVCTKLADVFCFISLFQDKDVIDLDVDKTLPDACRRISFPRIPFRGFVPYKLSDARKFNEDAKIYGRIRYPFLYEETLFNKLIKENKSEQEIFDIVSDVDLYTKEEVQKNFKLGMKMIEIASAQSDIKIYDYICKNIKNERLYRDGLHYENNLYCEFARRLADYLGIDCSNEVLSYENLCREKNINLQVATEVPILPSVAKHLGVEHLSLPEQKYQIKVTDEGAVKYLNFKEWVYAYVGYTKSIMKINDIISLN